MILFVMLVSTATSLYYSAILVLPSLLSLLRKENAAFKARVLVCDGSVELLDACGFKDQGEANRRPLSLWGVTVVGCTQGWYGPLAQEHPTAARFIICCWSAQAQVVHRV